MSVKMTRIVLNALYFVSCFMAEQPDVIPELHSIIENRVLIWKVEDHYYMWPVGIMDSSQKKMKIFMY